MISTGRSSSNLSTILSGNIPEALERAARESPSAYIELADSRARSLGRFDFAQMHDRLREAAKRVRGLGVEPGDRVVVGLPSSWDWFDAWFGSHLAGALPVSIAPPGAIGSPRTQIEKTLEVARRIEARRVFVPPLFLEQLAGLDLPEALRSQPLVTPEDLSKASAVTGRLPGFDAATQDTAFLQLTSGSTGVPRAVMISHGNVLHHMALINDALTLPSGESTAEWLDTIVSWLPLYHDMGLIGQAFNSLLNGHNLHLLAPRSFLARPHLWLQMAARGGRVLLTGPNFGYQLCAERVQRSHLEGLDLSGIKQTLTGSEMVRAETVHSFSEMAAEFGFDPRTVVPCYGMAETTLAVSFDRRGRGVRTRSLPAEADSDYGLQEVVSNGAPALDTEIAIVGPDGSPRGPDKIGEVRVRGPGVFQGYWQDPDATAAALEDGWLRTGDLGFLDESGELYLTGRIKEILILHGQNLMPHELEWIADEISGSGGAQRSAAFSVTVPGKEGEGEQAVLLLESSEKNEDSLARLEHDVRSQIGRRLSIPLADLMLLRRGSLPKTSSGKVQRRLAREAYLRGELERLVP